MTKFKVTYGVWSFYWNQMIRFEKTVDARNVDEAIALVKADNRLAEEVSAESIFTL
jgi:hypothetical protein